jgi:acetyl esterase/lipase
VNRSESQKKLAGGSAAAVFSESSKSDAPGEPTTFTYETAGDCEIKLDAHGSDPSVRKPVMVYIHGGALITGSRKTTRKWLNPQPSHVLVSP